MTSVHLLWRRAWWSRVTPRPQGAVAFLILPALFFLPWEKSGIMPNWSTGANLYGWLGTLVLASVLCRDCVRPRPSWIWLYQKGIPLDDFAIGDWLLDLAFGAVIVAWWAAVWYVAATTVGQEAAPSAFWAWTTWVVTFGMFSAVLFMLGAHGWTRGSDVLALLAFLAYMQLVFTVTSLPGMLVDAVHFSLPPLLDAPLVSRSLRAGDWAGAAGPLLHIVAFTGICVLAGTLALRRWRPGNT